MPVPRAFRVVLYLHEEWKHQSDRLWNNLMALDFCVTEEHERAGVIIGTWERKDIELLERVPGVAALRIEPIIDQPAPPPVPPIRQPKGKTKALNGESRLPKQVAAQ